MERGKKRRQIRQEKGEKARWKRVMPNTVLKVQSRGVIIGRSRDYLYTRTTEITGAPVRPWLWLRLLEILDYSPDRSGPLLRNQPKKSSKIFSFAKAKGFVWNPNMWDFTCSLNVLMTVMSLSLTGWAEIW